MGKINIIHERWDYLIILDACRYDYFREIYRDYLEGALEKRISVGSSTKEWRNNNFDGYFDDIVYISANPLIASKIRVKGFVGNEHFYKVYDIWKEGWDKDHGTVLPEAVTKAAKEITRDVKQKRFIIHYLQPHAPYLSLEGSLEGFADPNFSIDKFLKGTERQDKTMTIRSRLLEILINMVKKHRFLRLNILGDHPEWVFRQILSLPPKTPMDAVRRKYGRAGLRKAYKENLKIVLEHVKVLVNHFSGRIVVTSDHGELLGEGNCYTHIDGSTNPLLIEVPWLVIDKKHDADRPMDMAIEKQPEKKVTKTSTEEDHQERLEVEQKLRALGYFD